MKLIGYFCLFTVVFAGELDHSSKESQEQGAIRLLASSGLTPLHHAASEDALDVVRHLIDNGANINAVTVDGLTPLQIASKNDHLASAKLLLEKGANVNAKDKSMQTALHHAAQYGNLEIVRLLIANRADVNATDSYAMTPLHYAAKNDFKKVVAALKYAGGRDDNGLIKLMTTLNEKSVPI